MKNELDTVLTAKKKGKFLFMAHCIAGYPSVPQSQAIALALAKAGANIIELQIPFSDPMADGPTITQASQAVVEKGFKVKDAFRIAKNIRTKSDVPVVLMTYLNIVYRHGIERFAADAKRAGVSGLIVPDAPFDSIEGKRILHEAKKNDLHFIFVVSPGVSEVRLNKIAKLATGFVYATTRQGTTGANSRFASDLNGYIRTLKKTFSVPVCLGFGIKARKDVQAASSADIIVAGSVFVEAIQGAKRGAIKKQIVSTLWTLRKTI